MFYVYGCLVFMYIEFRRVHWVLRNWSHSCDLPCGCWELDLSLLEEQAL